MDIQNSYCGSFSFNETINIGVTEGWSRNTVGWRGRLVFRTLYSHWRPVWALRALYWAAAQVQSQMPLIFSHFLAISAIYSYLFSPREFLFVIVVRAYLDWSLTLIDHDLVESISLLVSFFCWSTITEVTRLVDDCRLFFVNPCEPYFKDNQFFIFFLFFIVFALWHFHDI